MSTPVGALGASTSNIPSKRKRKNNQRILSDSEGTSEREDIQAADAQAKGAAAEPEPPSSKDKKRRRKKRRRQSIVDNAEGLRAQVSSMPSPNVPRIKPRSATAKKAKTPVAGPSNANVRPSTPAIASSPPARAASPELLASPSQPSTSSLKGKGKPMESDDLTEQIDVSVLSAELADLKAQLAAQKQALSNQRSLLSNLHTSLTCQICLDPLHKPYALAPCGHVACHTCLVAWFRAPPADAHPDDVLPVLVRKKTCPHCRAVLRERPIEVWTIKDMVGSFFKSGLADPPMNPPASEPAAPARADPWEGIFRQPLPSAVAGGSLFFSDPPPAHMHDLLGLHDAEDGGIFRCVDCGHEIWDGVCSSCARVYPGHNRPPPPWGDDDDDDDDDGDDDDGSGGWMDDMLFRNGPWGFGLGTDEEASDDDEHEDDEHGDEVEGPADGARNAFLDWLERRMPPQIQREGDQGGEGEQVEEGEDDDGGYESSFIDDEGAGDAEPAFPSFRELLVARHREVWDEGGEVGSEDEPAVEYDQEEDADVEYAVPVARRSNRLVVNSDEDDGLSEDGGPLNEEYAPSEEDGPLNDNYAPSEDEGESGLAEVVADRERYLYGDDGSIPRVDAQSSEPLDFASESGSDLVPDDPHAYDDGAGSADEDDGWVDDSEAQGDYGPGEEESVYGDSCASGDEYEYGDAW